MLIIGIAVFVLVVTFSVRCLKTQSLSMHVFGFPVSWTVKIVHVEREGSVFHTQIEGGNRGPSGSSC